MRFTTRLTCCLTLGGVLLVVVAVVAAQHSMSATTKNVSHHPPSDLASYAKKAPVNAIPATRHQHKETGPYIDGAETPHLIPDVVAYSLFLRMMMERDRTARGSKRQHAYVRHVLGGAGVLGRQISHGHGPQEPEIRAVIDFIATYQPKLEALDAAGGSTREEHIFVRQIVAMMPDRLGTVLTAKLQQYVTTQFKAKVKIIY